MTTVTRFFQVAASLQVLTVPPILVNNLRGRGLTIEWSVSKTITRDPDTCEVRVYNLSPTNRDLLALAASTAPEVPLLLILSIGWDNIPSVLFSGSAWKVEPALRERTDVVSVLTTGDGLSETRDTPPAGGAQAATAVSLALASILGSMRLAVSPAALALIQEAAAKLPLPAFQHCFSGEPTETLDAFMDTLGLAWGIQGGQFVVLSQGINNELPPLILQPSSGLLTWTVQDDGGVAFDALALPQAVPGQQVFVKNELGLDVSGGPLRIESINFNGSTMGNSTMSGIARKLVLI